MTPKELSPSQAAVRIGATTRSVQRWIAAGSLPARRVGGRWRVASDVLDAFIARSEPARPAGTGENAPVSSPSPLHSVFVANRGEIAARVSRTCARLGVRAVVPSVDGPGAIDLLDARAVVRAALEAGAEAVHPGYGFLAEAPDFAEAVEAAGLRWIGPPPGAIRAMGDKSAARRLAASLGIPVTPGYDGTRQDDATLRRAARRIGLPVIVKPAAGGGGKGMRVVRSWRDLGDALAAARREAAAAFGDDRLVIERLVEGPRHVEVQVLFDAQGAGVHLGERDCSAQRRHQKVLEETPSPAVDASLRAQLGEAALRLAAAVGYVSAGTCEFLLADDGSWTFLEMNTRLQVEHPVTEAVTGRDLVADQLGIAAGESLTALGLPDAPDPRGHAIEVRLYAEDAEAGFLPATGRIEGLRWPVGEGIRVDAGIAPGSRIDARFDPMLAKIVARGRDRTEALERLTRALDETVVLGVVTNLRFLRWLVRQPWLVDGQARVDTLTAAWRPGQAEAITPRPDEGTWRKAALALVTPPSRTGLPAPDAWSGGWRLNGPASVAVTSGELVRRVAFEAARSADAVPREDASEGMPGTGLAVVIDADGVAHVDVEGRSFAVRVAPPPDVDRAAHAAIASVRAAVGVEVAAGDPLVVLEAMKMEHAVVAPAPGVVIDVAVRVGDQVTRDQRLATIEA
jgi:excisionase family DNA binding protein